VDFFNGHPSPQAETLAHLIREETDIVTCGLIVSEVLQGLRQAKGRVNIERHFREMDWLRNDNNRPAREGMLDLLRDAFNNNTTVIIDYNIPSGKKNGVIIRLALTK
jgi:hypothetical protein